MNLTREQMKEALRQHSPEIYLSRVYNIERAEARALIADYEERRTKTRVKNTKLSLIAASALAIAGTLSYLAVPQQSILLPRPANYVRQTPAISPADTQNRITEEISAFCDIQEVLNPGQPKTLYIFPSKGYSTRLNPSGKGLSVTASPEVPLIQAELLSSLIEINKYRTIEAIVAETVEWEKSLPYDSYVRNTLVDHNSIVNFFQTNPLQYADIAFAQMFPSTTLAGVRARAFEEQFEAIDRKILERYRLSSKQEPLGEFTFNDPVALGLYKQQCQKQGERSLAFLERSIGLLDSRDRVVDTVVLVIGANHCPGIYDNLSKNPRTGITVVFPFPRSLDSFFRVENHKDNPAYFSIANGIRENLYKKPKKSNPPKVSI